MRLRRRCGAPTGQPSAQPGNAQPGNAQPSDVRQSGAARPSPYPSDTPVPVRVALAAPRIDRHQLLARLPGHWRVVGAAAADRFTELLVLDTPDASVVRQACTTFPHTDVVAVVGETCAPTVVAAVLDAGAAACLRDTGPAPLAATLLAVHRRGHRSAGAALVRTSVR